MRLDTAETADHARDGQLTDRIQQLPLHPPRERLLPGDLHGHTLIKHLGGRRFLRDHPSCKKYRCTIWLGWLVFASGVPTAGAGIALAYTGFSGVAMTASMSASVLLLIWIVLLGIWMWRLK